MPSWWEYLLGGQQAPVFPQGQPEPTPLPMRPMAVPPQFAMPPEAIAEPTRQVLGGMGGALQGIGQGALNLAAFPGRVMQAGMAGTPYTTEQMVPWAAEMATNMVGAGSPFAQAGAVGSAGGKPGIRAFHGSPHDFERFDIGRIGTGEGAQAYGHGLYFAEAEGTAKSYREALAPVAGETFGYRTFGRSPLAKQLINAKAGDIDAAIQHASEMIQKGGRAAPGYQEALPDLQTMKAEGKAGPPAGHMYEVNIKAQPEQFLDWDKPLSQQPESVRKFFEGRQGGAPVYPDTPGQHLPGFISPDTRIATEAMREAGIPGIRYLDQGSRADMPAVQLQAMRDDLVRFKKQGNTEAANALEAKLNQYDNPTRNYVVFNDALIDIMRKYGLIGMLGGTTAAPIFARQDQQ